MLGRRTGSADGRVLHRYEEIVALASILNRINLIHWRGCVARLESTARGGAYSPRVSQEKVAMSTMYRYALPVEQTEWKFDGHTDVSFTWEY